MSKPSKQDKVIFVLLSALAGLITFILSYTIFAVILTLIGKLFIAFGSIVAFMLSAVLVLFLVVYMSRNIDFLIKKIIK